MTSKRTSRVNVRSTENVSKKLEYISKFLNISQADVIEQLINGMFLSLKTDNRFDLVSSTSQSKRVNNNI